MGAPRDKPLGWCGAALVASHNAVADPVYKAPVHRDAYPDAETGFTEVALRDPVKQGAYLVTLGHCMECHSTWQRGVSDHIKRAWERRQTICSSARKGFRDHMGRCEGKEHHIAQNRWNRRLERRGHQACDHTGGTARCYAAQATNGFLLIRQNDQCRPCGNCHLPPHGATA
jgi:hypothetical protein